MLVHHAHPLPPNVAEQLALRLGWFIAEPIIRWHSRESTETLPAPWKTAQPDRGFAQQLESAFDRTQANWPWRTMREADSVEQAEGLLTELKGQDVAIASFGFQLIELPRSVELDAAAYLTMVHAAATPLEARQRFIVRHLTAPLPALRAHPDASASIFRSGGALDQTVSEAALDLSRALAVLIERIVTPAPGDESAERHFADLTDKPRCTECRPDDPVLHEEPGRVWVAPARMPGTILSLPVS
jgi:hypothetical protein